MCFGGIGGVGLYVIEIDFWWRGLWGDFGGGVIGVVVCVG